MIILAPDITKVQCAAWPDALFVVADRFPMPDLAGTKGDVMRWSAFEADFKGASDGRKTIILVGMTKIRTPSNRGNPVWGYLHNHRKDIQKVSVDRTLFVSEPWRAFFQFYWVHVPYGCYTYSYLAESHWRAAADGVRPDPFSQEAILSQGMGIIRSQAPAYFAPMAIDTVAVGPEVHAEYNRLKAACFDEEHTIGAILARLAKFAQQAVPTRSIPTTARLFEHREWAWTRTDLKIDEYLTGRLTGLVELTNGIARSTYDNRV
jgi:hypothetical protein